MTATLKLSEAMIINTRHIHLTSAPMGAWILAALLRSYDRQTNKPTGRPTNRQTDHPTEQLTTNQPSDEQTARSIGKLHFH